VQQPTLPVPDYDRILLCDLPARLEGLDASELEWLLEHERSLAARPAALSLLVQRLAAADEHGPRSSVQHRP
jgi:hypothetical protein